MTPSISFYAQTARSYALVFACVLGQTLALLSALHAEQAGAPHADIRRGWLIYAGLVTLGAYLNEMALLVLAAHAITVLLARYGRRTTTHWAASSALGCVLVTPLLALSFLQHGAVSWIPPADWDRVRLLYQDYFGSGAMFGPALLVAACAVVAVLPPRRWWRRREGAAAGIGAPPRSAWWNSGGVSLPSVAVPLLLVPAGLLLLESEVGPSLYQDRYVLYGEAGAALLAGAGVHRIGRWLAKAARRRELMVVPAVAVCACVLVLQLGKQDHLRAPFSRAYNYGGPSFYVGAHARSGDGVLFMNPFYRKAELAYPQQFRKTSDVALAVPPATAASFKGIDKPFPAIRKLMLSYQRIWVIGRSRTNQNPPPRTLREANLLLQHDYTQVLARRYAGVRLTLWVRR